ncbi:hypothetical protein FCM35_KLT08291 [Carex littledalei]|uniref:EF-hand domain-containing protein n=1 Tax=Carex littledalei TaxID=544730 RepID=A0A833QXQ5_9POAL|nr:hypothetical protein FCM35_KLT08291 [Carex littledalei]
MKFLFFVWTRLYCQPEAICLCAKERRNQRQLHATPLREEKKNRAPADTAVLTLNPGPGPRSSAITPQEILALHNRFCQLDRNSGGFISVDEFMSVPDEFNFVAVIFKAYDSDCNEA